MQPSTFITSSRPILYSIYGVITSRNAVRVLMPIELLLNAVNLNLMVFKLPSQAIKGQVFTVCDYSRRS